MSKYRIVKHQAGEIIRYCPEILVCTITIGGVKESWRRLAGNKNLTSLDLWVWSLPETIEEAKSIIEKHIEDQKPKYSEEVVYEYDTEKKEQQKKLLTEIMEADQKNGLYDIPGVENNMTAVDLIILQLKKQKEILKNHFQEGKWNDDRVSEIDNCILICENTKQIEKEQICDAFDKGKWDTMAFKGTLKEQYYNQTYGTD
jgi:hypothetical protein